MSRLKILERSQSGFSLVETAVAVAISGLIGVGLVSANAQVLHMTISSQTRMAAVKQVESAVHWLNRDAQMAQIVEPHGAAGFPLNLTWTAWDNSVHQVTYRLADGNLLHSHSIGGAPADETVVARHINPDQVKTNCTFGLDQVLSIKLTATVDSGSYQLSETRICEIKPRPIS